MKVLFPMHVGSGNRGCEGIVRGTNRILEELNTSFYLLDKDVEDFTLDQSLGLEKIGSLLVRRQNSLVLKLLKKANLFKKTWNLNPYADFLKTVDVDSIVLFSGGDLYCYKDTIPANYYIMDYLIHKKIPVILWGASVDVTLLSQAVLEQMKHFKAIICRESLSFADMKEKGLRENLFLVPDPAFCLDPVECELPPAFNGNEVVGINVSPIINDGRDSLDSSMGENILELVKYILDTSDRNILLIPHVTWNRQDDRKICALIKEKFDSSRVSILDVSTLGYLQIRHIISQCSLFIGARTHAIISAYSTCVPSLAIGYSIKSKGIAKDLGLDERLVFDCHSIQNASALKDAFLYLEQNSKEIKSHLQSVIPNYRLKCYAAKDIFSKVVEQRND